MPEYFFDCVHIDSEACTGKSSRENETVCDFDATDGALNMTYNVMTASKRFCFCFLMKC